jgi:cytochrome c oxidase assembly factor CtaG/cytochrome c2
MTQHELLMLVAAPLLVLSRPLVPLLHGLPAAWRGTVGRAGRARPVRATWRVATTPLVAWTLQAVVLWVWHAPALFQATLSSELVHAAQHVSFLGAALLFWWSLVHGRGGVASYGAAVLYLFTTSAHSGALGALLSLAPRPWYPVYAPTAATFGLTALEDQQLGGLVMWVPAATVYVFAALVMLATWLRAAGREARARLATACVLLLAVPLVLAAGCDGARTRRAAAMTGGDPRRGRVVITSYGCPTCHAIPGVAGADGLVGPPLGGIGQRVFIAGVLPNTPDNMVRWLRDPPGVDRLTAMPNMGVGERDARDIAAYLYALR